MKIHETNIDLSIQTNIIGTANVVRACKKLNIKLIYFLQIMYPCNKGNYKETDKLLPINNYAWSKLGGESSVQMLKFSYIKTINYGLSFCLQKLLEMLIHHLCIIKILQKFFLICLTKKEF